MNRFGDLRERDSVRQHERKIALHGREARERLEPAAPRSSDQFEQGIQAQLGDEHILPDLKLLGDAARELAARRDRMLPIIRRAY